MKKLLRIVVIGLLLSYNANADNISEFEVDGMSIGESALKYFSKSELKKNKQKNWYKKNNYSTSTINEINISYKTKDKKYLIVSLEKYEYMNIDKCLKKLPEEFESIKNLFGTNIEIKGPTRTKHWADKSKMSWYEGYYFYFPNKDTISVECYNWSDKITSQEGWTDHIRFMITANEFNNFLRNQ
jgi:hypothetical protein